MADYNARVLPFINKIAYVTAKAGVYPGGRVSFRNRFSDNW